MASRKRYKTAEVLQQLDLSDDEYFEEDDSDRESDNQVNDIEPYN